MSVYSVYFSPTGGTKAVARLLTSAFSRVKTMDITLDFTPIAIKPEDIVFVSVPCYGGRVPFSLENKLKSFEGNNALAIANVVYGNRAFDDALIELYDILTGAGFNCIAGTALNAKHSIFPQYGKGRPDKADKEEIRGYSRIIKEAIENKTYGKPDIPGNRPYQEGGMGTMKPLISSKCTNCGTCIDQCPVHAITIEIPHDTHMDACIGCLRCIEVCPEEARYLDPVMHQVVAQRAYPLFKERKENYIYI